MYSDVVVAGASVAGLLCAREVASRGHRVSVIEEDYEVGTPEHCGGLMSLKGLQELGVIPFANTFDHHIEAAVIQSPDKKEFTIDASEHKVVEISRRELDKQIAHQAQKHGTEILLSTRFQEKTTAGIRTNTQNIDCKIFVDARGASSLVSKDRTGILPSAQYEVYADWITKGVVRVFFDQVRYPGFFAWVIPSGAGKGKVGVAGRKINPAVAIDLFLKEQGPHCIIRKIYAPIWIKGPIGEFVSGNTVIAGDAAGQAKPTTAGGIYTSGMGGIFAGRAISEFLDTKDMNTLSGYRKRWDEKFGKEFQSQLHARRLLEGLDNKSINKLFGAITPKVLEEISKGDFDFHTSSIVRLLGVRGSITAAQALIAFRLQNL